jgi:hypothetical protein
VVLYCVASASNTEAFLTSSGKLADASTLSQALSILSAETQIPTTMPETVEGLQEHRHALAQSLLFKFYHNASAALASAPATAQPFPQMHRDVVVGTQTFEAPSEYAKHCHFDCVIVCDCV